jgi:predicted TPR repeat methyltransferase
VIKQRQDGRVVCIEIDKDYAAVARDRVDRVVVADAEAFLREIQPETPFDCVIAADVLEHLVDPWTVVERSAAMLAPGGTFVVSLPNVFYWKALWRAVRHARWPRDDQGIFDRIDPVGLPPRTAIVRGLGARRHHDEPPHRFRARVR